MVVPASDPTAAAGADYPLVAPPLISESSVARGAPSPHPATAGREPAPLGAYARTSLAHALTALVVVACVAPVTEEFAFRGALLRALAGRYGDVRAVLVSAGGFALLHGPGRAGAELFVAGIALGALAWGTRSVWGSVVAHSAWNAFAFGEQFWPRRDDALFAPAATWTLAALVAASARLFGLLVARARGFSSRARAPGRRAAVAPPSPSDT
jgi:membrane protease YdiL (CAAX protease family)